MNKHEPRHIELTRPLLGAEELEAVRGPLQSGWLTQGREVASFEAEFSAAVGARHACAVSNCTAALHLALCTAGAGPGTEVITASHSFIATANAIRYCGARPRFVDVAPGTFNIAAAQVDALIGPRTAAILCVHQMGMPCDLRALVELARDRGLPLIEDAACAAGSAIRWAGNWEQIGRPHGDVCCFSFHPRKVITTGEGGMLTTARADWDQAFRSARQHGMSVPDTVRHHSPRVLFESYSDVGFNYRMTDLQAAIGRAQLRRLPEIVQRRRVLAERYGELLGHVEGCAPPLESAWARSNWQSYCVRLPEGCDQRALMQCMLDQGVATRRGIMCIHREPAYADIAGDATLPESEAAQDGSIILPLYPQMTPDDQDYVVQVFERACSAGRRSGGRRSAVAAGRR